jgi:O-antigen ligase
VPVLQIALGGAFLLWFFGGKKDFGAPQFPLLFAFLFVLMLSLAVNGWMGGTVDQLSRFGPIVAAFVLVANAVTTHRRARILMATLVLCTLVPAVHGIDQKAKGIGWTGVGLIQEDGRIQYLGIFNDPNDLGMLFVIVLPMALLLSRGGGIVGLRRLFWLAAAGTILYAIYLTNSRGALLATASLVVIHLWRRRGFVVAALVGVFGLAGLMMLPSRLSQLDVEEASAYGRVDAWYEGLQMFVANPVFGIGANQFSDFHTLTAHNSFVLVLAETGIIGFTIWIAFLAYCYKMIFAVLRSPVAAAPGGVTEDDRNMAATLLLSLSGCMVAAFFLSRTYIVVIYLLAGLIVGYYLEARRRVPALPRFPLGNDLLMWPFVGIAGAVGLYVVVKVLLMTV